MTENDPLKPIPTIEWIDSVVRILDQRSLPRKEAYLDLRHPRQLIRAIRSLAIRGAPALGIAGAFGVALAAARAVEDRRDPVQAVVRSAPSIARARPTAVNLSHGVERALAVAKSLPRSDPHQILARLVAAGREMLEEDWAASWRMAEHGVALLPEGRPVLTHCNTGGLATGGLGTALAVIRLGAARGRIGTVFVDETRPLLQGGRLTLWELERSGIASRLICDGAAAWVMKRFQVGAVLVGADRIAANGDTANKIGTFGLALAARGLGIPFYVVAPWSTFDPALPTGEEIPVEERADREVLAVSGWGPRTAAKAVNPAFDVTPAELVTAWVTERGILDPPFLRTGG